MKENFVIMALGSNMGDRSANLSGGIEALRKGVDILNISPFYLSEALLKQGSPKEWNLQFHNCVVTGYTSLTPQDLLILCEEIESEFGHKEKGSWAPRYLDIDIIAYNEEKIEEDRLTLPHKHMHLRSFVVVPLSDIMPEWNHPVLNIKVSELSERISKEGLVKL